MSNENMKSVRWVGKYERNNVYTPAKRPGFTAWVTAFDYGDGGFGVSFDETIAVENKDFKPKKVEFAEAVGAPVSYGSVEGGSANLTSYRVYMKTYDGKNFEETGRCVRKEGSYCNAGFPDGRILGFDVPKFNDDGSGWSNFIRVRESIDGGNTWKDVYHLLEGTAPYLWRVRRLRDGTIVILASLYGTPWGQDEERVTRNTMLPGESYLSKIQPFFITTKDGINYSGPHYVLPGIGAHEFDFVELPSGELVFIAGDVQATPVGRQIVTPSKDGWINGTMFGINGGAPANPMENPQGGIIPETIAWCEEYQCIIGYRRNKCFSISTDLGENWIELKPDFEMNYLYQPVIFAMNDKTLAMVGHVGGDAAFGQNDMYVECQVIEVESAKLLPKSGKITIERLFSDDNSHHINAFSARLTSGENPIKNKKLTFRFTPYWNDDGSVSTGLQENAPYKINAVTDENGCANAKADMFDNIADIYLSYNVDVCCEEDKDVSFCQSPTMVVLAMAPHRNVQFPYDAYFAEGTLFLSPEFLNEYPSALEKLQSLSGDEEVLEENIIEKGAIERLANCGVIKHNSTGKWVWIKSVHAPRPLDGVKPMASGDTYI